jgi:hypothetical protein
LNTPRDESLFLYKTRVLASVGTVLTDLFNYLLNTPRDESLFLYETRVTASVGTVLTDLFNSF